MYSVSEQYAIRAARKRESKSIQNRAIALQVQGNTVRVLGVFMSWSGVCHKRSLIVLRQLLNFPLK